MAHALLSASGAHRWLNCTRAPRMEEKIPDTGSMYAAEGTLAHAIAEQMLLGQDYTHLKDHDLFYPGMVDEVEEYVAYCQERLAEMKQTDPLAFMAIELRLPLTKYIPQGFGTADAVLVSSDVIEIVDLKFGKGVEVSADDNPQLMLYALGAYEEIGFIYGAETVRMTVAQVRLKHIQSAELPLQVLQDWGEHTVKPHAYLAFAGKGDFSPG